MALGPEGAILTRGGACGDSIPVSTRGLGTTTPTAHGIRSCSEPPRGSRERRIDPQRAACGDSIPVSTRGLGTTTPTAHGIRSCSEPPRGSRERRIDPQRAACGDSPPVSTWDLGTAAPTAHGIRSCPQTPRGSREGRVVVVEHIMVAPGGIKETINRINESLAGWLIPPGAQGIQSGTPGKPGGTRLWGTISPHGYLFKAHTHIRGLQCKKGKTHTHTHTHQADPSVGTGIQGATHPPPG